LTNNSSNQLKGAAGFTASGYQSVSTKRVEKLLREVRETVLFFCGYFLLLILLKKTF
jgi:hypothetical protein